MATIDVTNDGARPVSADRAPASNRVSDGGGPRPETTIEGLGTPPQYHTSSALAHYNGGYAHAVEHVERFRRSWAGFAPTDDSSLTALDALIETMRGVAGGAA